MMISRLDDISSDILSEIDVVCRNFVILVSRQVDVSIRDISETENLSSCPDERKQILAWLLGSAMVPSNNYDDALEKVLKGTASWIFSQDCFVEWKQGSYPLLRLIGIREFRNFIIAMAC